jgi:putative transposase
MKRRCELLGVNRSSLYCKPKAPAKPGAEEIRLRQEKQKQVEKIMQIIDEIHTDLPAAGARKIARELSKRGYKTTRYSAKKLMEKMNIKACYPHPATSKSAKGHPKFPYLLKGKKIWLPNQVWATDITYVRCGKSHMYLTAIIDWYSRMILSWELSDTLDTAPVVKCVETAIGLWGAPAIFNSDQGVHFTSNAYIDLLKSHSIAQSMDGRGRWVDNVIMERWFRTLKTEHLRIIEYDTPRQLRQEISEFVVKYNERRLHQSLNYVTPKECFEAAFRDAA